MSLLDTTINTPITDIDQLFDLGFKTQYGLNYCFFDVPYTFDEQKIWICVQFKAYIKQDKCMVKTSIYIYNMYRKYDRKDYKTNNYITFWMPETADFLSKVVKEHEITYVESLQAMINECWVKDWFIRMVKNSHINFSGSDILFNK